MLSSAHFPRPRIRSQDTVVSGRRPPSVNRLQMQDHLSIGHLGGQEGQAYHCSLLPVEKGYSPSPPGKAKTGHLFCSPRSRPLILWSQARWPVTYWCLQILKVIFSLDIIHCLLEFKGYIQIITFVYEYVYVLYMCTFTCGCASMQNKRTLGVLSAFFH